MGCHTWFMKSKTLLRKKENEKALLKTKFEIKAKEEFNKDLEELLSLAIEESSEFSKEMNLFLTDYLNKAEEIENEVELEDELHDVFRVNSIEYEGTLDSYEETEKFVAEFEPFIKFWKESKEQILKQLKEFFIRNPDWFIEFG